MARPLPSQIPSCLCIFRDAMKFLVILFFIYVAIGNIIYCMFVGKQPPAPSGE